MSLLLATWLSVNVASAADLASIEVGGVSPTRYATPGTWNLQANHVRMQAALPAPVGRSGQLTVGVRYALEAVRSPVRPDGFPRMPLFHAGQFSLAGSRWWSNGWVLYGQLTAGVAGDLAAFDSGVTRYGGTVTVLRSTSRPWTLGAGVSLNYSFGRLLPVPLVLFDWTISDATSLSVVFPASADLVVKTGAQTRVGARALLVGNQFAIRDPALVTAFCGQADAKDCLDHLSYSATSLRATVGKKISETTWVEAYTGVTLLRRFALLSETREPLPDVQSGLPAAVLAGVSLHYGE